MNSQNGTQMLPKHTSSEAAGRSHSPPPVIADQKHWTRHARLLWLVCSLLVVSGLVLLNRIDWARSMPSTWTVDAGGYITHLLAAFTQTTIAGYSVVDISRGLSAVLSWPQRILSGVLTDGFRLDVPGAGNLTIPAIPWFSLVLILLMVSTRFGGRKLMLLVGSCLAYFLFTGLWSSAISTLVTVAVAIPIGCGLGLLLGTIAYRHPLAESVLEPVYDTMQTLPIFSYLVLIVVFFGFGPIAGLVALVIYAMPPMARITTFALRRTPSSIIELAQITGCTPRQQVWSVQIPAARATLLTGLNQVIMLTFSTVIICAIIGGEGLGADVLKGLKSMRLGGALVAGVAITLMAIMLDRACRIWIMRRPEHSQSKRKLMILPVCVALALGGIAAVWLQPQIAHFPRALEFEPGKFLNQQLRIFNVAFQPQLSAIRDSVISGLLRPTRELFLTFGWLQTLLGFGAVAWATGGRRLALLVMSMLGAVALFGLWEKAMVSLYLVLISTLISILLGLPLGILAGLNRKAFLILEVVADTLQTLPAFVYLIPVVMLFEVGDFAAFIAIVLYGLAPVSRYVAASLQQVGGEYKEVARMNGCSGPQQFFHVLLPLAVPQMLLGVSQTIMLSFGMLIVVALVGSQGLEAETLSAIGRVQPGQGLIAGLGIAALAISVDRIVRAITTKFVPDNNRASGKKA